MGVSPLSLAAARFCPGYACALGRASSGPPALRPAAVPYHRCAGADAVWGRYLDPVERSYGQSDSLASFRHFCTVATGRPAATAALLTLTPASRAALMSARCVSVRLVRAEASASGVSTSWSGRVSASASALAAAIALAAIASQPARQLSSSWLPMIGTPPNHHV